MSRRFEPPGLQNLRPDARPPTGEGAVTLSFSASLFRSTCRSYPGSSTTSSPRGSAMACCPHSSVARARQFRSGPVDRSRGAREVFVAACGSRHPSACPSIKNSTCETDPNASEARAISCKRSPGSITKLVPGWVRLTSGGRSSTTVTRSSSLVQEGNRQHPGGVDDSPGGSKLSLRLDRLGGKEKPPPRVRRPGSSCKRAPVRTKQAIFRDCGH